MNDLIQVVADSGAGLTMSSREIADLTGKEHFHVKRDIKAMLEQLGQDASRFGCMSSDAYGRPLEVFELPKDLTLTLVAGYSAPLRHRIVTRWLELETRGSQPLVPQSLPEALRLAADLAEKKAAAEAALAVAAPKAQALDRIATAAEGSLCITDAAKALQIPPRQLFSWLQANQWIYRRAGCATWLGYQDRVQAGLLEHKVTTVSDSTGRDKLAEQVRVTAKGMTKLAGLVGRAAA